MVVRQLRVNDLRKLARQAARDAGLDTDTADAVARRVVERHRPHCDVDEIIRDEVQKHAAP